MKASNYLTRSIAKFKEDAFSKVIYDVLKSLLLSTVLFSLTHLFPKETILHDFLSQKISVTIYVLIVIILSIIILTILVVYIIFQVKYKKLQSDHFTDELTGLKNHLALKPYLEAKMINARTNNHALSIILMDIDNFKATNDRYSYATADLLLKKLGNLLDNDKRVTDETFRYFARGDEFLIVASETPLADAVTAAERKRNVIANAIFEIEGQAYHLKVSCGVTEFRKETDNYETITLRAEMALKDAKIVTQKNCTRSRV